LVGGWSGGSLERSAPPRAADAARDDRSLSDKGCDVAGCTGPHEATWTILGVERGVALPAALIARTVTLWMGVGMGAIALFRVSALLGGDIDLDRPAPPDAGPVE
jgi:hypothetical protein